MADWRKHNAPKVQSEWKRGGQRLREGAPLKRVPKRTHAPKPSESPPTAEALPSPAPKPSPKPSTRKVDFATLLDLRGISAPRKGDLEAIAEEFLIDISGATKNSERVNILADFDFEVDA